MKISKSFQSNFETKSNKVTKIQDGGQNLIVTFCIVTTDLNYWIKHPFEFSDPILKPEYL